MFTGLVQGVGRLSGREVVGGDVRLRVAVGTLPFAAVELGESIAINGVCLTVVGFDATSFSADASNETLAVTTLGALPVVPDGRAQHWTLSTPRQLSRYLAQKGSICVDGVSLTVNAVDADSFEVALIPHTLAQTAFGRTSVGDRVNLEVDLVARYVERLLESREPTARSR